jgi:large subunit ribosomal protein L30
MGRIRVTQTRSVIDRPKDQKATMIALGLKRIGRSNEFERSPQIDGMIRKVSHLIKIEEI